MELTANTEILNGFKWVVPVQRTRVQYVLTAWGSKTMRVLGTQVHQIVRFILFGDGDMKRFLTEVMGSSTCKVVLK